MNKLAFILIFSIFIAACGGGSSNTEPNDNSNLDNSPPGSNPVSEKPTTEEPADGSERTSLSETSLKNIAENIYYSLIKGNELNQTQYLISRSIDAPYIQLIHRQSSLANLMGVNLEGINADSLIPSQQAEAPCSDGGSVTRSVLKGGTFTRSVTFNQCISGKYTINGEVKLTTEASIKTLNIEPKALSVNVSGKSIELDNMTYVCEYDREIGNDKAPSCSKYNASYRAANNKSYQFKEFRLWDDDVGHVVLGELHDPDLGSINIDGHTVLFECDDMSPDNGLIHFTSQNQSGTVRLSGCHRYTVTYQGVSNTYDVGITP